MIYFISVISFKHDLFRLFLLFLIYFILDNALEQAYFCCSLLFYFVLLTERFWFTFEVNQKRTIESSERASFCDG